MKRRLFLTGPIGCGKSTAIEQVLGAYFCQMGGFLTRRIRNEEGRPIQFALESPDGQHRQTFLDFSSGKPEIHMDVFSDLGVRLLEGKCLLLDEIGGIELLCSDFFNALEQVLQSDIPIIGVVKGDLSSGALIRALGLSDEYVQTAALLRRRLQEDENTLVYTCEQFDKMAPVLVEKWAQEYLYE